jgi:hypothetical protein
MFPRASIHERSPERDWRRRLRRAVDLAVAFVTLEDGPPAAPSAPGHPDAPGPHPHRRPLRSPQRARRPGSVPARVAHCTTPLVAPAPRRRRRSRARNAEEPPPAGRLLDLG